MPDVVYDFTFRPLQMEDIPLLHGWLNAPHMRAFYQKAPIALPEVEKKFAPRIQGKTATHDHIAEYKGSPIGKLQCYRISDYPEYADEIGIHEGIGIDLFIGESSILGQGIGRKMLKNYMKNMAFALFPEEVNGYICHELTNTRARACSVAAGFCPLWNVIEAGIQSELLIMRRCAADMDEIRVVDAATSGMGAYKKHLADAVILTRDHRLFLQKRYDQRQPGLEIVNLFGGHVEEGETPVEAVLRELQEETGGMPTPVDLIVIGGVTEGWTNHTELVHVWFWHDCNGTITGCYEREAIEFASAAEALRHPGLMPYAQWALAECQKRKLIA